MVSPWPGIVAAAAGALALYISSRHQALVTGRVRRARWGWSGAALLVAALGLLLAVQGRATAIFTWFTIASLVWTVVPAAARWWRFRGEPVR